jgi:hypothetical protein
MQPAALGVSDLTGIYYELAPYGCIEPAGQALSYGKVGAELSPNVVSCKTAFGSCHNRNSRVNGGLLLWRPFGFSDRLAYLHGYPKGRQGPAHDFARTAKADDRRKQLWLVGHNSPPNSKMAWLSTLS